MTTFVFRVRNVPAALYKALGGFATNGVNMTKLESYMMGGEFTATQFLCDVEGHPEQPALRRALEELSFFSTEARVLGVYPMAAFRLAQGADVMTEAAELIRVEPHRGLAPPGAEPAGKAECLDDRNDHSIAGGDRRGRGGCRPAGRWC